MSKVRTLRFHTKYGPEPLFNKAREQVIDLAGLSLKLPHAKSRFDERGIPMQYLTDFRPECWELITVETALKTGRITYMSLRSKLDDVRYLWIVLAYEHVITAWITDNPSNRATNPRIVQDGPAWDAAADGRKPERTRALAEWEEAYTRCARAQEILIALNRAPDRPSGDRLAGAARLVLSGATWNEAAVKAGWVTRKGLDAAIVRLLRAAGARHERHS